MNEETLQADVTKGGETFIRVLIKRSPKLGTHLNVWTLPHIEEFFRRLSDGNPTDPMVGGRYWYPIGEGKALQVYGLDSNIYYPLDRKGVVASLSSVGVPIITANGPREDGGSGTILNMGFLRLVGTSEPNGVTFGVKGVYSTEMLNQMRDYVAEASKKLYIQYMKPVNIHVMISTQGY
jgi:hypothetical protein